jgi:hypothetical protein
MNRSKSPTMRDAPMGTVAEKRTGRSFDARLTVGSGAFRQKSDGEFTKGDQGFRFENKATEKKSMSLKREWLEKISREAHGNQQIPMLTLQFMDGEHLRPYGAWVCLPEVEFKQLLEQLQDD